LAVRRVKLLRRDGEPAGMASHLIGGYQYVIPIESGVLHSLRQDRSGELLHSHRELKTIPLAGVGSAPFSVRPWQQYFLQEIENRAFHDRVSAAGFGDGGGNHTPIEIAGTASADVGAIDRKAGRHFAQHCPAVAEREV